AEEARCDFGRRLQIDAARREETVVARVVRDRRAERDRAAGREQVREREPLEDAHEAARRSEERVHLLRVDAVVLYRAGYAESQPRLDQRVAERHRASDRSPREVGEHEQVVVELRARRPIRVEEVRLEETYRDELTQRRDLRLQRERLSVAEQVRLLDLRR